MGLPHIAIYARVSSSNQDIASQRPDLDAWLTRHANGREIVWYEDTFTGTTLRRPGMQQLEADIASGRVCALVVWRLDRLGRTAREMLAFLDSLERAGVEFISVRDGVDPNAPTGRLMRTILAAFAEYEREVISQRIRAGIARAKADGKRWGGRREGERTKLTPKLLRSIQLLLENRTKKSEIAAQLGISRTSVYAAARLLDQPLSAPKAAPRIPTRRRGRRTSA